jgi:hypothetical protein
VAAAYVSQLSSLPLLGVDGRRYLDFIVPACRPNVVHVGKLRLVELARAVEALRAMAPDDGTEPGETAADPQPETVDGVLRQLGKQLVAP